MSRPRRRLQRLGLVALGALVVFVGARQLAALNTHDHDVRHVHTERHAKIDRDVVRPARDGDVLFAEAYAVREGDRLVVDLGAESLQILPARGREATVTVRGEGRNAQREFERRRFSAGYSGGTLDVRTDPPRGFRMRTRDAKLSVVIEVPVRFHAEVDVASGAVHIERIAGDVEVHTGSGAVRVGTAEGGRIHLDTGSGAIRADVLSGDVRLDTGSGGIRVGRVTGSFVGDTGSGAIRVDEADVDRFVADTGSGGVTARLLREAEIEVDTGSGGVTLTLPATAGADVDLSGRPLRIDSAFGFRGDKARDRARGRIGGGGPTLDVDTGSGGITLQAR